MKFIFMILCIRFGLTIGCNHIVCFGCDEQVLGVYPLGRGCWAVMNFAVTDMIVQNGGGNYGGGGGGYGSYGRSHANVEPEGTPIRDRDLLEIVRAIKLIDVRNVGNDSVCWDDGSVVGGQSVLKLVLNLVYIGFYIEVNQKTNKFQIQVTPHLNHGSLSWDYPGSLFDCDYHTISEDVNFRSLVNLSAKRLRLFCILIHVCSSGWSVSFSEKSVSESVIEVVVTVVHPHNLLNLVGLNGPTVFNMRLDSNDSTNLVTISDVNYKTSESLYDFIKHQLGLQAQLPPPAAGCATLRAWQAVERRVDRLVILERP